MRLVNRNRTILEWQLRISFCSNSCSWDYLSWWRKHSYIFLQMGWTAAANWLLA